MSARSVALLPSTGDKTNKYIFTSIFTSILIFIHAKVCVYVYDVYMYTGILYNLYATMYVYIYIYIYAHMVCVCYIYIFKYTHDMCFCVQYMCSVYCVYVL